MRALVTGCFGFVGRYMVKELIRRGYDVYGCDIKRYDTGTLESLGMTQRKMISADALDIFSGKINTGKPYDLVVHCAYHVGGREAIDGQPKLLARNTQLDASMFDWAVRTEQKAVLYFSSSAAYPIKHQRLSGWIRLAENLIDLDDVEQPDARYGWAKLTGEQMARAAEMSDLRVHVVRPFSGYGIGQDLCYPFMAIMERVCRGEALSVWGPPSQCRDWIHITDVVAGALAVVDCDIRVPVNLCSGVATEMGDLSVMFGRAVGRNCHIDEVRYLVDRPTGVGVRVGDTIRLGRIYQPMICLEEGIEMTIRGE